MQAFLPTVCHTLKACHCLKGGERVFCDEKHDIEILPSSTGTFKSSTIHGSYVFFLPSSSFFRVKSFRDETKQDVDVNHNKNNI